MDDHGALIDQATLAEFIESGALYTHIRRSRAQYAQRLDTFVDAASKLDLPMSFPHTDGGMNLAGFLEGGTQDKEYSKRLQQDGLEVPALFYFSLRPTPPGLVFGFTAFEPQTIRESMKRVARVLHRLSNENVR